MTTLRRVDPSLVVAEQALRRGDAATALRLAADATRLDPMSGAAWWLQAHAAMAAGRSGDAEVAFSQGARSQRVGSAGHGRFLVQRARPLIDEGRMAEAVTSVRVAMAGGLDDPDQMLLAAFTLIHAGLADEALPLATGACAAAPDEADAWYSLGSVHEYLGNRAEARSALERAIATAGGCFSAASYKLSHLQRWTADDNHVAALAQAACRSPHDAARIAFALFKEYDDLGDNSAAWNSLQHGATIMRRQEPWSAADEAATVAAWRRHLPATAFDTQRVEPSGGPRRIFVIGLPRSGTTLVERILAAHSQVHAMGEPKAFAVAVRRLTALDDAPLIDARVVAAAADVEPRRIAEYYTREMALFGAGRAVTIDKRTQNIHYVGLIRRAFPNAAIVALDRAPMDALFGAYKRLFAGSHNWSYAQDDLADHYRNYRDLIDHWAAIPAIGLIRVSLETLIVEPEIVIRDLLDACALPFEDACLRPHQATGAVMTASASQVRDPINAAGVGAWQRYRAQLMPLYGRLAAEGLL